MSSDCENFVIFYKSLGGSDPRFLNPTPNQCCFTMAPQVVCRGFTGDEESIYDSNQMGGINQIDNQFIVKLNLNAMNLRGPISPQLSTLLPNLYFLNIGDNPAVVGPIPNLGQNLKFLRARNAGLNGDFQNYGFFGMTNLLMLDLSNNQLTGQIPSSIGQLGNLKVLDLGNNKLIGQIPNEISLIYPLLSLRLAGNPLTGSLPQNGFTNLQKLDISTTWMTGSLPYFDGRTLPMLDVSDTYISGQIPPQLLYSTSAKQASLCPFINSKVTLPLNTLPPSTCPSSIMNFNGANQRPITIPGMGNDRGTPQANPASSLSIGLLIGVVAAAALILVLLGARLVRLKKRQNLAQHISPPTLMKPGSRPFSTSTFDTLDSSLYGDNDEEVPLQRSSMQYPAPTDLYQHQTNPANGPIQHSIPTRSKDQVQVDITAQDEKRHITFATPIDESDFGNQVQVDIAAQDEERITFATPIDESDFKDQVQVDIAAQDEERNITFATPIDDPDFENQVHADSEAQDEERITFTTPIDESDFKDQVQVDIAAQDEERNITFATPIDDPDFENQVHADSEAQDDPPIAIAPDSDAVTSKKHVSKLVHPNPIAAVAERSSVRWSLAESSEAQDDPPIAIAPDSDAATSKNHVSKLVHPNPIAAVAERSSVRWSLAESV